MTYGNNVIIDKYQFIDEHKIFTIMMYETFTVHGNLLISVDRYNKGMNVILKNNFKELRKTKGFVHNPFKNTVKVNGETIDINEYRKKVFHDYMCKLFGCSNISIKDSMPDDFTVQPCIILERGRQQ